MPPAGPSPGAMLERRKRIRADLSLLLVAIIWGSAFVAQRIAAVEVGVYLFNGLRFLLGGLVLMPLVVLGVFGGQASPMDKKGFWGVVFAGLLILFGAGFQQAGLRTTTAANAGFITGTYVIFVPIILAIGMKKSLQPTTWMAAGLAVVGLFLLSSGWKLRLNPGDALELVCAIFWSLHVILIGWLVQRQDVMKMVIGQYLVCGLLSLLVGLVVESQAWPALLENWWVVVYTGIFSVGVGYTLQAVSQRVAPPSDAAVILSGEAIFAAFFGWLFLSEALGPLQLLGCAVILCGMLLAQVHLFQRSEA